MDLFEALTAHHDEIRRLFAKVQANGNAFSLLRRHLIVHHEVEEGILYGPMGQREASRAEALKALEEHHVLEMMLVDGRGFPKKDEAWPHKLTTLQEIVEYHFSAEENRTFGVARQVLSGQEARELGERFVERKDNRLKC